MSHKVLFEGINNPARAAFDRERGERAIYAQRTLEGLANALPGFGVLLDLRKVFTGTDLQGDKISGLDRVLAGLNVVGSGLGFLGAVDDLTNTGRTSLWTHHASHADGFGARNAAQAQARAAQVVGINCNKCFTPDTLTHRMTDDGNTQAGLLDGAFFVLVTGAAVVVLWDLQVRVQRENWQRRRRHRIGPAEGDSHYR